MLSTIFFKENIYYKLKLLLTTAKKKCGITIVTGFIHFTKTN